MDISEVAGKDRPIEFNDKGGGQSSVPVRFDLVDGKAMFKMCAVLHEGAEKYGANNWRLIDVDDHLNHLIMHAYAYLAGDRTDEHLSHIMCRAMFAQAVELQEEIRKPMLDLMKPTRFDTTRDTPDEPTTWLIHHNLNGVPHIDLYDEQGNNVTMYCSTVHMDKNTTHVGRTTAVRAVCQL